MILRESSFRSEVFHYMSDSAILAATVKTTLLEIAKQAAALGSGLQNAAPGDKTGAPNNSINYLLSAAENLYKAADECDKYSTTS